ncbi:MAG: hypothetical protein QM831_24810 [Kofleriaceae bacterium]
MGSAFQDDCGSVSAYGLVYDILRANPWLAANGYQQVTVFYSYLDTKASPNRCNPTTISTAPTVSSMWTDGCDIVNVGAQVINNANHSAAPTAITTFKTLSASPSKGNVYPQYASVTVSGATKVNYLGGPFVILPSDAGTVRLLLDGTLHANDSNGNAIDFSQFSTRNATQTAAPQSGCSIGTDHYVNIHITTTAFVANIGKAFQAVPPRLALLATNKLSHTSTISDGILQAYLQNAGLTYTGANGCPPSSVNATDATKCPTGANSGQIYDTFDFDDIMNGQLSATSGGNPLYTMLWTPHWEVTHANLYTCSGSNAICKCTSNCTSCAKLSGSGTCTSTSSVPGPPNANETVALGKISTFLDGQTGLAAECASITSYEGDMTGGAKDSQGIPQFQTCLDDGTGKCAGSTTPWGIDRNGTGSYLASNIRNCSDPNLANNNKCVFYAYPGDSFAQTGDYSWSAVSGHTQAWLNNAGASSIYKPGVVPLISQIALSDQTKVTAPTPYNGSASAAQTNIRPIVVADLVTRNVKDNTGGKANILYLAGHDEHTSVSGTKVMLETLLQLGISTLPPIVTTVEVARSSPIDDPSVEGNDALVQGTYEFITSSTTSITVPTFSSDPDANTFKYPFTKGHLRARVTGSIGTTASGYNTGTVVFDAAGGIPDANYAGCTHFTSGCRTVFTTTGTGQAPPNVYLEQGSLATLGPLMASNLTTGSQAILIQRILAGDDSLIPGFYRPALGGIDRSTVAIIPASALVKGDRPAIAYVGADDGMMHAICMETKGACDIVGRELWAYLPRTELSIVRYNTGRIDGSPHVIDAYGDFTGSGERKWSTLLFFQTGTGDTTGNDRKPAVYALDVSDPTKPTVAWEYSMTDVNTRGSFELGVGLTLSAGRVQSGLSAKTLVFAQTNNGGTAGGGDLVTAINAETATVEWQKGYVFTTALRSGGTSVPSATGIPGGVAALDKTGNGYVTDIVWGTLYGDMWMADPLTGVSRYGAGVPLFRASTDNHPIGTKPAIYWRGAMPVAVFATGGYVDTYPSDTNWSPNSVVNYAVGVNLTTPLADAPINENKTPVGGTGDIQLKINFGAGERGIAQATVVNSQVYITTDSGDTNNNTNPGAYGTTGGATGHVYSANVTTGTTTYGTTVVVEGGATSVAANKTGQLYVGSSDQQQRLGSDSTTAAGKSTETTLTTSLKRKLWLRSM